MLGIDINDKLIRLCNFLASEHPDYKVNFVNTPIEHFLQNMGEYDLVLCMNILHNMSKYLGVQKVKEVMADLNQKVAVGIFEFAVEKEHQAYNPEDYRDYLPGFPFIKEIAYSESFDGSGIQRPICFASDKYVWFENFGMMKIDSVSYRADHKSKNYISFQCGDKFVKFFYAQNQMQYDRMQREITFLQEFGGQRGLPKLLATYAEQDNNGLRIFIVRESLQGDSLHEKISSGETIDRWDVVKQALDWMIFLEQHGYYHGDVKTKNFIYGADGKLYVIDYEDIFREPISTGWPYDLRVSFLIFINVILDGQTENYQGFHREFKLLTSLKKHLSPTQYEQIAAINDSEKFFARMYEILFGTENRDTAKATYDLRELEFLSAQSFLDDVSRQLKIYEMIFGQINASMNDIVNHMNALAQVIASQQQRIEHLEKISGKTN